MKGNIFRLLLPAALGLLPVSAFGQQVFIKRLFVAHSSIIKADEQCRPGGKGLFCATPTNKCPNSGDISNNPHIEFDMFVDPNCNSAGKPNYPFGASPSNICNNAVFLCAQVGWSNKDPGNADLGIDLLKFEVFKFGEQTNPLDANGAAPVRTFFIDDPGVIPANSSSDDTSYEPRFPPFCVMWDGSINIKGELGKSNGQYGFRATVATNKVGAQAGNINIEQTRAYPSGATLQSDGGTGCGLLVEQKPVTVDVVNVHVMRASPTVVGALTAVAAEPYNLSYRLSKDATTFITIHDTSVGSFLLPVVRTVVPGLPRVGEGVPSGTLQNGDAWDGRFDNGDLAPPGVYMASVYSVAQDQYGADFSVAATRQIGLDTLLFTDIQVQPLTDLATSLAVLSYVLTEPATVYIDIYPPGTYFLGDTCNPSPLNSINYPPGTVPGSYPCNDNYTTPPAEIPKKFNAAVNGDSDVSKILVRHIQEHKVSSPRKVFSIWDGRDKEGRVVPDGDYVFVLYASLHSRNGFKFGGQDNDRRIWSTNARSGVISVSRGMVGVSQITPSTTLFGSSPAVAGLDPFTFSYTLSRDAIVSMKIYDRNGQTLVKTLVDREQRPGNFLNRERWNLPVNDRGLWVTSGTYLAELTAYDPFFPAKAATTTVMFPVNLFRITDVVTSPLLTGATDVATLNYQLSQPMMAAWNIYPPGSIIQGSTSTWPPCAPIKSNCAAVLDADQKAPVGALVTIKGMRPSRLRITEFWDGRDQNGLFVPDGNYIFTLTAQSTTTPKYFATDQVVGQLTVARGSILFPVFSVTPTVPQVFNSSQIISLPPYDIEYSLTRQSSVTIQILNTSPTPKPVRVLVTGGVRDSNTPNREFWDGRDDSGNFVEPGFYTVQAIAEDLASVLSSGSTAQQTISVNPLRVFDVAISALRPDSGNAVIAYQVSETMKVAIKVYKPGTAFDRNGNPFPPEKTSLVKRIVGVRPGRTEISDTWDGTDEKLTLVPDGNYIFKIKASTDIHALDTVTGDEIPGASTAEDVIIAEIPVVRSGSVDPMGDFNANTIIYPNPVKGSMANVQIYVPIQARVTMRAYTIAGEMVLEKDFGVQASDTYVQFPWAKVNHAGRPLAHGVYFVLFREEPIRGERTPLQIVRKVLFP